MQSHASDTVNAHYASTHYRFTVINMAELPSNSTGVQVTSGCRKLIRLLAECGEKLTLKTAIWPGTPVERR